MGDNIFSQAEIDALLNGDSAGDESEAVVGNDSEVKPYDPTTQRRVWGGNHFWTIEEGLR